MSFKVSKKELAIAICIIPFFTFAVGYKWPLIGIIVYMTRYAVFIAMLVCFVFCGDYKRLLKDRSFILLLAVYAVLFVSTWITRGKVANSIQLTMYATIPFLISSRYWKNKKGAKLFLGGINIAYTVLIFCNLLIMLVYPQGIYSVFSSGRDVIYYLLGEKNQMVAPLLTGMAVFIEISIEKKQKIGTVAIVKCAVCVVELLIGGSGTGLLVTGLFIMCIVFYRKRKQFLTPKMGGIILVILFVCVVLFRIQYVFSFLIEGILHKSLTLSNRTFIWDTAIGSIMQSPIIGYGVSDSLAGSVLLKLDYVTTNTFAHNMYLDYMLMGGFVGFAFLISFLLSVQKRFVQLIEANKCVFCWYGLWLYLVASLADIYTGNYCMFLLIAYAITKLKNVEYKEL